MSLYRPGSRAITEDFYNDMSTLFESTATCASPVIVIGDFNIHVDVADDPAAVKFQSVLTTFGYTQHVKQPTHRDGHVLDLILTNSDMSIQVQPIDPPLLPITRSSLPTSAVSHRRRRS